VRDVYAHSSTIRLIFVESEHSAGEAGRSYIRI
jgi:hypothetical protein